MIVRWVCKDCNSNNLIEYSSLMQCQVCGKVRTTEPFFDVDTEKIIVTEIEKNEGMLWKDKKIYPGFIKFLLLRFACIFSIVLRIIFICIFIIGVIYLCFHINSFAEFCTFYMYHNISNRIEQVKYVMDAAGIHANMIKNTFLVFQSEFMGNITENGWSASACLRNMIDNTALILSHARHCCELFILNVCFWGTQVIGNIKNWIL